MVACNRHLAHEMSRVGGDAWEVTTAAPTFFHGGNDLRPQRLQPEADEPCPLVPLPAYLTRQVHVFFYGRALRSLLQEKWDLVHCWEEPYILAGGQVAHWTPPETALVIRTAQNQSKWYPPPFNMIERHVMGRAAAWVCSGRTVEDALQGRPGYDSRPFRCIPLGVDTDRFRADPQKRRQIRQLLEWDPTGPPVVGFVGRFVPEKGLRLLTRVLDGLMIPWRALFVGAGMLEIELRDWARRHGNRVRICTDVNHDAVPAYLNAMDILCAPSQTTASWREQFGRMLIEAFASGVPVIGSDSGEIPHILQNRGLIVGERDEDGWRQAVAALLESPARRRELAEGGVEAAHKRYAWSVVAGQHLEFFQELIDQRHGDAGG